MTYNISFVASNAPQAQEALQACKALYPSCAPEEADIIVALGGDGFMLRTLHHNVYGKKPVYGMNCGSIGFLMNSLSFDNLEARLEKAVMTKLFPLKMQAQTAEGSLICAHAINEVSLLRQSPQSAIIDIQVDGKTRLESLMGDGIMVATPAGSTAYNFSAHGPILPIGARLLALTPMNPFRPRRWRGALLPDQATVTFLIQNPEKRPVSAAADDVEVRNIIRVDVHQETDFFYQLLYDPHHNLESRILNEQFLA